MNNLLFERRSQFIDWLMKKDMYITLAVMSQCRIQAVDDLPCAAGISIKEPCVIMFHTATLEQLTQDEFNTLMLHELYHFPQLVYSNDIWKSVEYPEEVTTPEAKKALTKALLNMAMDMSLHEQLAMLLTEKKLKDTIKNVLVKFKTITDPKANLGEINGCFATEDMEKNKDTAYYVSQLIKNNVSFDNLDSHEFEDVTEEQAAGIGKMIEDAVSSGKAMANGKGRLASDQDITLGKDPLLGKIRTAIERIRTHTNRIAQGKSSSRYNWGFANKFWTGLPGRSTHVEKTSGVFFVADTSGSMCSPQILNQMIPAVEQLAKRHLIVKAYSCDTELTGFGKTVKGGGGTELTGRHVQQIRDEHKLKPTDKIDIIYLTDGQVWGLEDIEQDPYTSLHLVLV